MNRMQEITEDYLLGVPGAKIDWWETPQRHPHSFRLHLAGIDQRIVFWDDIHAVELDGQTLPWRIFRQRYSRWFAGGIREVGILLSCSFHPEFRTHHVNGSGKVKILVTVDECKTHTMIIRAPEHVSHIKLM